MMVPGLMTPGQRTMHRHAEAAFPGGALFAVERRDAAIGPCPCFRPVVGAIDDNGVVRDAEVIQLFQHGADHVVVLNHAVGIEPDAGAPLGGFLQVGPDVHARGVEPDEERFVVLGRLAHKLLFGIEDFHVHRFHPSLGQGSGVLDFLTALAVGPGVEHAARAVFLLKLRILRVVIRLRFLLRVQMVEVAEELIEAMHRRQMRVLVAEMVFAELAGGVALRLEQVGDRRRPIRNALRRTRHADGQQPGAERMLPQDERGAARRAALLRVGVGKQRALLRQSGRCWASCSPSGRGCRR